jgi:type II secretory ATPase GspE/PulE/Tfp pilus assembly ATPase PilB-like protein
MGVEPYLISSTLMAVLAQRLVRRICGECKAEVPVNETLLKELGLAKKGRGKWKTVFQGQGCPSCKGTGYQGRVGMFELLVIGDPLKKVLLESNDANTIRDTAVANGMTSMRKAGEELVRAGVTTIEEILHASRED